MKQNRKHHSALFQLLSFIRNYFTGPANKKTDSDRSATFSAATPATEFTRPETENRTDDGELFVVWDALGDGRAVGIFDSEDLVRQILAINPYYYRYYRCKKGQATGTALEWLDEKQRAELLQLLSRLQTSEQPVRQRPAADGFIRAAEPADFGV